MPRTKERLSARPKANIRDSRQQNTPIMQSKAVQCRTNAHRTSLSVREIVARNLGSKDCAQFAGRWQDQLDHCPASALDDGLNHGESGIFCLWISLASCSFFPWEYSSLLIHTSSPSVMRSVEAGPLFHVGGHAKCHAMHCRLSQVRVRSWGSP